MSKLTRRELLKISAGTAAGLCAPKLLTGQGTATQVTKPAPTACSSGDGAMVTVAQGDDLDVMTRSALNALGGIHSVVKKGESVFIKPNMVTLPWAGPTYHPFQRGECTKPEIIIAVIDECLKAGAKEIIVGDGSQMPKFDWSKATTLDGTTNLAAEAVRLSSRYGASVRLACLDVDTPEWIPIPVGTSLGTVVISSLVTDADHVISIPVAKTHKWAYLTLSLKNFIGITPLERYGWVNAGPYYDRRLLHKNDMGPHNFGRLFVDIAKAAAPDLAIIDMSIGMEGDGPSLAAGGRTVDMSDRHGSWIVLASTDAVAADATAARVLNLETPYVPDTLGMAHAAGMGTICQQDIELVGATLDQLRVNWLAPNVVLARNNGAPACAFA